MKGERDRQHRCARCGRGCNNGAKLCHLCRGRPMRAQSSSSLDGIPPVAAEVVRRRLRANWSQAFLAEKAGVHPNTIHNFERGRHVTAAVARRLLDALPPVCSVCGGPADGGERWCREHQVTFERELPPIEEYATARRAVEW